MKMNRCLAFGSSGSESVSQSQSDSYHSISGRDSDPDTDSDSDDPWLYFRGREDEMKRSRRLLFSLFLAAACLLQGARGQGRKPAPASVAVDVESYALQVRLNPESHEVSAAATVGYRIPQPTDKILFELSENLSVQKVLDPAGVELEFGQDETGPGQLIVRFAKPVAAGARSSLKVEYSGGFDRDRF
ncbi:MAG: M1 family metallopeptidase, partial [Armatimonadetes bacterium]|nr:M1 family metallopeptidase [Armatimonadota bacterium]